MLMSCCCQHLYSPLQYIQVVLVPRKTKLSKWWAILLLWSSKMGREWWMDSRDHKPDTTTTSYLFCTLAASFLSQYRPSRTRTQERERERKSKKSFPSPNTLSTFEFWFLLFFRFSLPRSRVSFFLIFLHASFAIHTACFLFLSFFFFLSLF